MPIRFSEGESQDELPRMMDGGSAMNRGAVVLAGCSGNPFLLLRRTVDSENGRMPEYSMER